MTRTQIQLTDDQLISLRRLSAASRKSIAEIIRQGVDLYLSRHTAGSQGDRIERALRVSGRFSSGKNDVSRRHDSHLTEAFES